MNDNSSSHLWLINSSTNNQHHYHITVCPGQVSLSIIIFDNIDNLRTVWSNSDHQESMSGWSLGLGLLKRRPLLKCHGCLILVGWTRPIWPSVVDLSCVCWGHQTSIGAIFCVYFLHVLFSMIFLTMYWSAMVVVCLLVGWTRPIWPDIVDLSCVCSGHHWLDQVVVFWLLVVCWLLAGSWLLVGWTRPIWPGIVDLSCVCSGHQTSNEFWSGAAHSSEADQANSQTQRWKTTRTQRRKKKKNKEQITSKC